MVSFKQGDTLKETRTLEDFSRILYPKETIHQCNIAQASRFSQLEKDDDNILFGSAIFRSYFDGDSKRPPLSIGV